MKRKHETQTRSGVKGCQKHIEQAAALSAGHTTTWLQMTSGIKWNDIEKEFGRKQNHPRLRTYVLFRGADTLNEFRLSPHLPQDGEET